jgi:hypothetical protein
MSLTKDEIFSWSAEELKKELAKGKERRAEIESVVNAPDEEQAPEPVVEQVLSGVVESTPEELAKAEADRVAAEEAARQQAAGQAAKAESEREREQLLKAAGITIERDAAGNVVWITQRYQAKDEAGNPIGSPTSFKVRTWEELAVKQQQAHENAVRYAERVKNRKPAPKKVEPVVKTLSPEELAQAHEESRGKDPVKAAEALKKITGVDQLEQDRKRTLEAEADARAAQVSYNWMRKHIHEFNPCEANANAVVKYIADNNLQFTEEALDEAFRELESQLAPPEVQRPIAQAPANPTPAPAPPAVVPAVVPPAAPAPTAVAAAPVAPPAAPIPTPVAVVPRPGVNSGIQPGQGSGQRPVAQKGTLTKAIINGWTGEQMKAEMRKPGRRAEIERVMNS